MDLNEVDAIAAISNQEKRMAYLAATGYNKLIKGGVFVLTGYMSKTNYHLEDYIYDHMGSFSSVVTSSTSAVVAGSLIISTKVLDARKLGVPVLTENEFIERFKVVYD